MKNLYTDSIFSMYPCEKIKIADLISYVILLIKRNRTQWTMDIIANANERK